MCKKEIDASEVSSYNRSSDTYNQYLLTIILSGKVFPKTRPDCIKTDQELEIKNID